MFHVEHFNIKIQKIKVQNKKAMFHVEHLSPNLSKFVINYLLNWLVLTFNHQTTEIYIYARQR